MEGGFQLKRPNPILKANILSKLTFAWVARLIYTGTKRQLDVGDLYKTLDPDKSDLLGDQLEKNWNDEIQKSFYTGEQPSLLKVIIKTFFWRYMLYGSYILILYALLRAHIPLALAYLIHLFVEPESDLETKMYLAGSVLVGMSLLNIFAVHHTNFGTARIGMRIRIACSSLIYRKVLKLSQRSLQETAAGQVVNILSNDVIRFDQVTIFLHFLWIMPIQGAIISYYLWQEAQMSAIIGVIAMILMTIPLQGYLGKATTSLRLKVAERCDFRVKLMNEIINGIQVIKMYAWEKPFELVIKMARLNEVNVLTKASYVRAVYASSMVFVERVTLYIAIVCYVLMGNAITADKVFSMAQFYNMLQLMLAIFYPMAITYMAESWVAIKRIQDFLMFEEIEEPVLEKESHKGVIINEVEASWVKGTPNLENITLHIPQGKLCAIVGPVGAGKSSILQLILGELKQTVGTISVGGEISYSSQNPWLFASSVKSNILFGQEYDRILYRRIVKVCALQKDFDQFPQGDSTLVGERGVSLSGGQRARINLARAVYRRADIYLLDDPLSAVDTHVGKHLFEECILRHLKGKTRILVTHQLQYLKRADMIVVMNDGRIEAKGTFEELKNSELDFTKMLASADETVEPEKKIDLDRRSSVWSSLSERSDIHEDDEDKIVEMDEEAIPINSEALKDYLKAGGGVCGLLILILSFILGQFLCSGADYWCAYWTEHEAIRHDNRSVLLTPKLADKYLDVSDKCNYKELDNYTAECDPIIYDNPFLEPVLVNGTEIREVIKTDVAVYVYTVIIVTCLIFTFGRSFLFFKIAMNSSKNLHSKMFYCLLEAPMRFFDTNPSGRILNRFSKDMGAIDDILPRTLLEAVQIIGVMIGILVMVLVSNYYMIIAMVVLGFIFTKLRGWYLSTAKIVKHLEGKMKSPVFTHVNSTVNGLVTIRASKTGNLLLKEFDLHQDAHTSSWYLIITTIYSFGVWLDMICVIFIACIAFSFIISSQYITINGAMVGLALSQSLTLTGMLQYGIKQTAEVVNQLISVERVMEYTKLEKEGPFETPPDSNLPPSWPQKGMIEFNQMSLRYDPNSPPVLRNLNFVIKPGEKIGIVGRTGAGKSSLISALFRLTQLEGSIIIDGVDINTIGLTDLRRRISIIPQEPVLFSASVRYNLDPFSEFHDTALWKALEEVELKDSVTSLDYMVTRGGNNFSIGQRQLVCLARAILRNNKILVLDEATANVDPRTDGLIQTTIRKKFKSCTVLTIAHRLNTIMDSDRVLVMDSGNVVEFDHPYLLLQDDAGYFNKMLLETGPTMTQQLRLIAEKTYYELPRIRKRRISLS